MAGNQSMWRRRSTSGGTVVRVGLVRLGLVAMRCSIAARIGSGREADEEEAVGVVGIEDQLESGAGEDGAVGERLVGRELGNTTCPTMR